MDTTYGRPFTVDRPGCQVHCWLTGPDGAPLVTLSHAALVDHTLFVHQLPALADRYRVLTGDIATSMPAWAAREPQAEYAVIAGAGHCSNYDRPAQVNEVICPFLQRVLPG